MVALQASLISFQALIKVALMENVFRAVLFPVAAGAVSEPGTGGTGTREVMPLPVLDVTCWHWTGPFNVGHETYGVFTSVFCLSSKSLPNVRACMCRATYPHTEIPQSVELSEVLWFSHGTWGQERKTPISGNSVEGGQSLLQAMHTVNSHRI